MRNFQCPRCSAIVANEGPGGYVIIAHARRDCAARNLRLIRCHCGQVFEPKPASVGQVIRQTVNEARAAFAYLTTHIKAGGDLIEQTRCPCGQVLGHRMTGGPWLLSYAGRGYVVDEVLCIQCEKCARVWEPTGEATRADDLARRARSGTDGRSSSSPTPPAAALPSPAAN